MTTLQNYLYTNSRTQESVSEFEAVNKIFLRNKKINKKHIPAEFLLLVLISLTESKGIILRGWRSC